MSPTGSGGATAVALEQLRANIQAEVDSAALYRTLAAIEARPALAAVYQRLAGAAALGRLLGVSLAG
jgi:hypothetical protein